MTERERRTLRRARPTILGPVFTVELVRTARRRRLYLLRALYAMFLMSLVFIAVVSMENRRSHLRGDSLKLAAHFAQVFYTAFGLLQLAVGSILVAAMASGAVADERQRKTIEFLFATDLTNREIVLGKFAVVMFSSVALLASAAPVVAISQLFGATPVDELARITVVSISTMAFLAAGCLLVSTLSTRPREAVVRAFVVAVFLLFGPLLLIFLMVYRPDLYRWIQPVHEFFIDANPLIYWVRDHWPQTAMFLPTLPGWDGVARLVWNQSAAAAVFLGWAILRVRAVHLAAASRPVTERVKKASRFSLRTILRPGLDVLPPMLWKELFLQSTIRGMTKKALWIAVLIDAGLFAFLGWYWYRTWTSKSQMHFEGFAESMALISLGVAWVYILVCMTRAATSMTLEREAGNWETLLSTRLTGPEIVVGKTFGAVLSLRILLLHILAFFAMAAVLLPEFRWHGARMCLATLAASLVVSSIGVMFSIRSTNSSRAVLATIFVASVFAGLFVVPFAVFDWPGDRNVRGFFSAIALYQSVHWAAFSDGPGAVYWGYRLPGWNQVGLLIQVAIGVAFMGFAAWKFDRWTGRSAQRASSSARQMAS